MAYSQADERIYHFLHEKATEGTIIRHLEHNDIEIRNICTSILVKWLASDSMKTQHSLTDMGFRNDLPSFVKVNYELFFSVSYLRVKVFPQTINFIWGSYKYI